MIRTAASLLFLLWPLQVLAQIAIVNVTVVDVERGQTRPGMTVLVEGDRIKAVARAKTIKVPPTARRVDGSGKFLIPGLWDMHAHLVRKEVSKVFLPLSIAVGVTGLRDMATSLPPNEIQKLRTDIADGRLLGPRFVVAGRILDGPKPINPGVSVPINDAAEARAAVRRAKEQGVDFIKVYSLLSRDSYFAIVEEAKATALPFAGHVPASVTAAEASQAGQLTMDHMFGVLEGCSPQEDELRSKTLVAGGGLALLRSRAAALETFQPEKAAALFQTLVRNNTWQVPTLVVQHSAAHIDAKPFAEDPRLKYIPATMHERWKTSFSFITKEDAASFKRFFPRELPVIKQMQRAGVRFLAGTDTPVAYVFPGFAVHDELAFFVQAGLTPAEALQTATINPAKALGKERELGTVAPGKLADLVLLSANPLQDIKNTQKISAVIANGHYLDRGALDRILADVESAARATQ